MGSIMNSENKYLTDFNGQNPDSMISSFVIPSNFIYIDQKIKL